MNTKTQADVTQNPSRFRIPFVVKLGFTISILVLLSTGISTYYIFKKTSALTLESLQNQIRNIGNTGSFLFTEQDRADIAYLREQVYLNSTFEGTEKQVAILRGEDGLPGNEDDGYYESLKPSLSEKIMEGPPFQRIVQILRKIRDGSRPKARGLYNVPSIDIIIKEELAKQKESETYEQDIPAMESVYLLIPAKKNTDPKKFLIYLADADYAEAEDDGYGEPSESNPIGTVTLPLTDEMYMGFNSSDSHIIPTEKGFEEDQWGGVVLSGYVPLLDKNKNIVAVLGIDFNVKNQLNQLTTLRDFCLATAAITFVLAIILALIITKWINRPIAILREGALKVASGNFQTRVDVRSRDELGQLGFAFNKMVHEIGSYSTQLQDHNAAFKRFVPQEFLHVMGQENIADVQLGEQVEREMTVLFSDIRSYTSISEKMNPTENFAFINNYLKYISPVIRNHNGFIDKFIGDAIMALFPNEADDAINNSIKMLQRLKDFNQDNKSIESDIKIGIGLHTGSVILGTIGEKERIECTVISDAVNLASRLESLTKRFGVELLTSDNVIKKSQDKNKFLHRHLGSVRVKGKTKSLNIVEIYNTNSEDQIELKNKTKDKFISSLEDFSKQNFEIAIKGFQDIIADNPDDKPAKVYYDYCNTKLLDNSAFIQ